MRLRQFRQLKEFFSCAVFDLSKTLLSRRWEGINYAELLTAACSANTISKFALIASANCMRQLSTYGHLMTAVAQKHTVTSSIR